MDTDFSSSHFMGDCGIGCFPVPRIDNLFAGQHRSKDCTIQILCQDLRRLKRNGFLLILVIEIIARHLLFASSWLLVMSDTIACDVFYAGASLFWDGYFDVDSLKNLKPTCRYLLLGVARPNGQVS
jgi:hypothetical protein